MDPFDTHRIKIAKRTLRLNDVGAAVLGGMTKAEARDVLAETAGWPADKIADYEEGLTR